MPLIQMRFDLPFLSLSLYVISIILLFAYNYKYFFKNFILSKVDILVYGFLMVTLASTLYSINIDYGLTRWMKLLLVVFLYYGMKVLFINKPHYINMMMKFATISLAVFFVYLMWNYLIKFDLTYIGPITEYPTREGKTALSFMTVLVIPFSIYYLFNVRKKIMLNIIQSALFLSTIVGAILIQSRAMYIVLFCYMLIYLILKRLKWNDVKKLLIITFVLFILIKAFVPANVVESVGIRVNSITALVNDNYVRSENSGISSINIRSDLLERGLNIFSQNPVLGSGMGSFMYYGGETSAISHNDYILVLAEQGLIGILLFVLITGYFIYMAYMNYRVNKTYNNASIFMSICGLTIYLLFINAYDNILLWTLYAMVSSINFSNR